MYKRIMRIAGILCALCAMAFVANSTTLLPHASAAADFAADRYIVKAKSAADLASLSAELTAAGSKVNVIAASLNLMVVNGMGKTSQSALAADTRVVSAGRDRIKSLIRPEMKADLWGKAQGDKSIQKIKVAARPGMQAPDFAPQAFATDPSFNYGGLMWSTYRVGAPQAWEEIGGTGIPEVIVGVEDTGIDFTHIDLADNVIEVHDFTWLEEPYNICRDFLGLPTDQELADEFGGPVDGDWNGHGSWIGGNIGGVQNGTGMNGIAPYVSLVALKISQNCGSAFDSEIISGIVWGADFGVDVINISFGGYSDRSDPEQDFVWNQYKAAVKYARTKGTAVVSSAGNDHVRIGKKGKVTSHGILTAPGSASVTDYFGWYETPAGIPGVVMVSALGNVVNGPSPECAEGTFEDNNATCKPESDAHQPTGIGRQTSPHTIATMVRASMFLLPVAPANSTCRSGIAAVHPVSRIPMPTAQMSGNPSV